MLDVVKGFLSFDRLLGVALVKLVYFFGFVGILGAVAVGVLLAFMQLLSNFGAGAVQLIAVPAFGAVALVYWRFFCELVMVTFQNHERLVEIRDRLPNYGEF